MVMRVNDVIKSVVFGVIEGVTEWLPVSSTGHLIIAESIMHFKGVSEEFYEAYSVIIQFGAVLSVAMIFINRMFPYDKSSKKINKDILQFDLKIVLGCIPAAVAGFYLDDFIEKSFYSSQTVAIVLIIYGILFIIVEKMKKDADFAICTAEETDLLSAIKVGFFQILSLVPGTSRSGATVMGGMLCSMSRYAAAEFSFFMAIPIIAGASFFKAVKIGFDFSYYELIILSVGFVTSFAVSMFVVEKLMDFVKKNTFTSFGIYRIFLGIILLIFDF